MFLRDTSTKHRLELIPDPPKARLRVDSCKINGILVRLFDFVLTPGALSFKSHDWLELARENLIFTESNQGHFRWKAVQNTIEREGSTGPFVYVFKADRI